MVTGLLTTTISQKTKVAQGNHLHIEFKKMSIQLNLDGLSFCIFNPGLSCIESIYHLSLPPSMPPIVA